MASDLNKVVMMGRLVRDPETRMTSGGMAITKLTIANNKAVRDGSGYKQEAGFFQWVAFGKMAEALAKCFRKGERIILSGRANYQTWQGADGKQASKVEFEVAEFSFVDKRAEAENKADRFGERVISEDEMPF
jgi:single-strand DNA-binding protein